MQVTKAENGYIVFDGGSYHTAKTLEEVFDFMLLQYEARTPESPSDRYGSVIILRCKCFQMNSEGLERRNAVAGCSNCSERLSVLV